MLVSALFFPSDLLDRYLRLPLLIFVFTILPVDILRSFNISLFLGINIIISGLNNIEKERLLPQCYQFYILYFCNIA